MTQPLPSSYANLQGQPLPVVGSAAQIPTINLLQFGAKGDGVTDNSAAFQAAVNALAGTGVALFIPAGTFLLASAIALASYLRIVGSAGATILGALTSSTGNPDNAVFNHSAADGATTTLTSDATLGSNQIAVAATISVGTYIKIAEQGSSGFRCGLYLVKARSGGGNLTLTLDRPVRYTFKSGDTVTYVTPLVGFVLDGNGMSITGTGDRYIELFEAWGCVVRDVNFTDSGGSVSDTIMSFDNPSFGCRAERLTADCASTPTLGFRVESGEDCTYRDCIVKRVNGTGFLIGDSINCHLYGCSAYECTGNGANFTGNTGLSVKEGSDSCSIVGGAFSGNNVGVLFDGGTNRCRLIDASIYGNTTDGVQFDSSTAQTMSDNALIGCDIQRNGAANSGVNLAGSQKNTTVAHCVFINGQVGVNVSVNSSGTRIFDCDFNGQTIGIQCNSDAVVDGVTGVAAASGQLLYMNNAASNVRMSGVTYTGGATYAIQQQAGKLQLSSVFLTLVANCTGFLNNGGVADIDKFVLGGSGGGSQGIFPNAGTTRLGLGIDVTAAGTPVVAGAGKFSIAQAGKFTDSATTTGTRTLTQSEAQNAAIKTTSALTGATTYNVPANVPGLAYDVENLSSNAFSVAFGVTGGTAITVAQGKRARLMSDGTNMQRISADT